MELNDAIKNVQLVLEAFVGTKAQHITIEQSFKIIIDNLKKDDTPKAG